MEAPHEFFVACAPGVEPLLAAEIAALGPARAAAEPGGVACAGDATLLHRLHLELGLALRVQLTVAAFGVEHLDALARRAADLPWERVLPPHARVAVRATAHRSRLYHTGAIAERVAAAVARRLGPPDPSPDALEHTVHARLDADRCTLSLDTSGELLHRRGYRLATAKAPLREDLARALLLACRWDPTTPLVDPFCGSGTLAIEAALLARRLPPGRARRFAFMAGPLFDPATWDAALAAALARALPTAPPILASDRDAGAVAATVANAERAGVAADIAATVASLTHAPGLTRPPSPPGAVVTNPPWGRRVGGAQPLRPLYQSLGHRLAALPRGWRAGILLADPALARDLGPGFASALMTDAGGTKVYMVAGAPRRR